MDPFQQISMKFDSIYHIDGLLQDCNISIANAIGI